MLIKPLILSVLGAKNYIFFLSFLIILPLKSKNFSVLYQGEDCKGNCDFQKAAAVVLSICFTSECSK